ncbi:unnamed protein product [Caenorhabditis brenneri]
MLASYLHTPEFFSKCLLTISILEFPLHIFGAYCILVKTPKMMKSVKWIMLNLHFWSVALDWGITFFTKPFVLFPAMATIPMGVLSDMGVPAGLQIYLIVTLFCATLLRTVQVSKCRGAIIICLVSVVCAAIVSIFENRYYLTFGRNTSWRHYRIPCMLFNYLLAIFIFLPAHLNSPEQTFGRQKLYEILPNLPDYIHNSNVYVIATECTLVVGPVVFMGILLMSEAWYFVWLMCLSTKKAIKLMTMSSHTVYMHKRFLRALYIQNGVLAVNMGVPFFYLGVAVPLNYYNQAVNNICFIAYSLQGLSSTIVMIWIHKPYRTAVQNIFCCKKSTEEQRRKSVIDRSYKPTFNISTVNVKLNYNVNIIFNPSS